jgi:hypothetical protein
MTYVKKVTKTKKNIDVYPKVRKFDFPARMTEGKKGNKRREKIIAVIFFHHQFGFSTRHEKFTLKGALKKIPIFHLYCVCARAQTEHVENRN